jgi:hypothetical protein
MLMMSENVPTKIPAMAGLLRCCDECGAEAVDKVEDGGRVNSSLWCWIS